MILIKGLIGALVVILIQICARTKNFYLAGLLPLFPAIAIIGYILVFDERGPVDLKHTLVFGMLSLLAYLGFLATLYLLVDRTKIQYAFLGATVSWGIIAAALVFLWQKVNT